MNNIFISFYEMFIKSKDGTPIFAAVCVFTLILVGFFFLIVLFVKKYYLYDLTGMPGFTLCYMAGHLLTLILLYRHFQRKNIDDLVTSFDQKAEIVKTLWLVFSLFILTLPIITIIAVLS